jgi:hypothetical protein
MCDFHVGVTMAKAGAKHVTVTDLTGPLLRNLLKTVRLNLLSQTCTESRSDLSPSKKCPHVNDAVCSKDTPSPGAGAGMDAGCSGALEFSDAESVSDVDALFDESGIVCDHLSGNGRGGAGGDVVWDVENVSIRFLDWKEEWDRLQEGCIVTSCTVSDKNNTSSAPGCGHTQACTSR